jgi:hypothetical protein
MIAQVNTNYSEGRAPLEVTFRAGNSYVQFPDGTVEACEFAHSCSYTWDVREQNGTVFHGPVTGGKEFSYKFTRKGVFVVVVYVCRAQACNFAAITITIR